MTEMDELKALREQCVLSMEKIVNKGTNMSKRDRENFNFYDERIHEIDNSIEKLQLKNYSRNHGIKMNKTSKKIINEFRNWLNNVANDNESAPFHLECRADPLLSTTDTAIINKEVKDTDVLVSNSEQLLRDLGVTFMTGLNSTLVLPSMAEDLAVFVSENASDNKADMSTSSITLNPRRLSHSQAITKETLATANPQFYIDILK